MARVAIEFTPAVAQGGGVGRSVREMTAALLPAATHDYTLFVAGGGSIPDDIAYYQPRVRRSRLSPLTLTRLWHRARIPLPIELFAGRHDLYFATDFALPPTLPGTRTAVFIHDLTFVRTPGAAVPRLVQYLRAVVPRSLSRASAVVVNSNATRADLIDVYGTPDEKIHVVQFGVHPRFTPTQTPVERLRVKYDLPDTPYIFAVGTIQPRKNYARLVQALRILRADKIDVSLVIAGGKGWMDTPVYDAVRAAGLEAHVKFLGYVNDADLPALYTFASAFAMPSLYEGFGLPVLEAMACGAPVVTSTVSSLPEAAGDAALLVDPTDVDEIADALRRVLTERELKRTLIERGFDHVAPFVWERTAAQLTAAFDHALRS
jgi:glycosyltransferase involved in cell wall biosynthesis